MGRRVFLYLLLFCASFTKGWAQESFTLNVGSTGYATLYFDKALSFESFGNDLKAYALGYGLKSRVANGGDTFRLHTKTYFRINMVGKGLKLYYALDPKDYADSPIPVQDVGHKNLYKDIPLCFKVRSGLSVKRAKQLSDDVCGKAGLTAGAPVDTRDYAADLVNYVNDGSDSGDDED